MDRVASARMPSFGLPRANKASTGFPNRIGNRREMNWGSILRTEPGTLVRRQLFLVPWMCVRKMTVNCLWTATTQISAYHIRLIVDVVRWYSARVEYVVTLVPPSYCTSAPDNIELLQDS